ncbi:hypothetical protein [Rubellicoccus peritrichatus]|uniref:Uncharacterized protein n=1 Tax=Rubellicoccus peritrichatus TaxID=3080537 RepID=A0AAQ3QTF9_9BACT|nr:hypothetical protein [Puniceicoccus sp. CR14]WOO41296.1 hypothetical protein RZN69_21970 [Puniceicoccus sp. CR14]
MFRSLVYLLSPLFVFTTFARAALWTDSSGDPNGWKYTDWFGFFWSPDQEQGWLYHETLGWLYAAGETQADIDFYADDLKWLYSSDAEYPVFYSYAKEDWLNYTTATDPDNPYWWSYGEQVFVTRGTLGFNIDTADLLASAWAGNFNDQRQYFWEFWSYVTALGENELPLFESYFTRDEIFSEDGGDSANDFEVPDQHDRLADSSGAGTITSLFFNEAATDFIRRNRYNYKSTFVELSEKFTQDGTPAEDRKISFPASSIGLKPIWFPILDELDPEYRILPVWDGDPQYPVTADTPSAENPPLPVGDLLGFKRAVVVDVTGDEVPSGTTVTISWNGDDAYVADVVSINEFYTQTITEDDLTEAKAAIARQYPKLAVKLKVGDFFLLTGMHILPEAEVAGKTVATFWWHPEPDFGPYSGQRLDSVSGVFRNFLMQTFFASGEPTEFDGSPYVIFNPYLEAADAGGTASSCTVCHSYAGLNNFPPDPDPRSRAPDDEFADSVGTDGWWSLVFEVITDSE